MAMNVLVAAGSNFTGHDNLLVTNVGLSFTSAGAKKMSFGNLNKTADLLVSFKNGTALN